jgi:hypothetical protein
MYNACYFKLHGHSIYIYLLLVIIANFAYSFIQSTSPTSTHRTRDGPGCYVTLLHPEHPPWSSSHRAANQSTTCPPVYDHPAPRGEY